MDNKIAGDRIVICGAGIGGLATALGLARRGIASIVLEQAPEIAEIGAGIQLGPNAFRVFDTLGISEGAMRSAVFIERCRLMDAISAEPIAELKIDEGFLSRFGYPYAVVHRAELHALMRDSCEKTGLIALRTNAQVARYEQDERGVRAILSSGECVAGRALIGADGLWSNVRAQLVGSDAPRVSGHTTYRAVVPVEDMPVNIRWNDMALWAGPNCHLVHYPLSGWKFFNLVVTYHNYAPEPIAGVEVSAEEVLDGFRHIHQVPREIISIAKAWRKWVLCDREPIANWVDGKVALLGDAAHPTMQYMAQGACMAMEDGVVLAEELSRKDVGVESALCRYQQRRLLRTARIVYLSREMGNHVFHPSGMHAALRNHIMGAKSQDQWHDTLDWLYNPVDLPEPLAMSAG